MMKKTILLIILVLFFSYYLTAKASQGIFIKKDFEIKSYSDIFYRLETSPISIDDIIVGSTEFALRMCADKDYQKVLGNTVESCNANVSSSKNTCASYLRKDSKKFYKDKHEVKRLTEQFIKCVSH